MSSCEIFGLDVLKQYNNNRTLLFTIQKLQYLYKQFLSKQFKLQLLMLRDSYLVQRGKF